MYLIIHDDGTLFQIEKLCKGDLEDCKKGLFNIVDTDSISYFVNDKWYPVELLADYEE